MGVIPSVSEGSVVCGWRAICLFRTAHTPRIPRFARDDTNSGDARGLWSAAALAAALSLNQGKAVAEV